MALSVGEDVVIPAREATHEEPAVQRADIETLLCSLRGHGYRPDAPGGAGSHHLNALWSLAYACGKAPEPTEVYQSPAAFLLPATDFFAGHPDEIREALRPKLSWSCCATTRSRSSRWKRG